MPIAVGIVLGALPGSPRSRLVNKTGEGLFRDILFGLVGAVVAVVGVVVVPAVNHAVAT